MATFKNDVNNEAFRMPDEDELDPEDDEDIRDPEGEPDSFPDVDED